MRGTLRYEFRPVSACNMCGSADFRLLGLRLNASQGFRPRQAEGIAVSVKQCRACDLIFPDPLPVPERITDHYGLPAEDYWSDESHWHWKPDYFADEIEAAKELLDSSPNMTALDIGAGLGKAMRSLDHAGFDTWGIEPLGHFRDKAIQMCGLDADRLQLASLEDASFPEHHFHFITFGAVLEHLYDPSMALEKALGWLKPGGVIQAEVPNARHLMPKLINSYFRLRGTNFVTHISPMHPPYHLYEFAPETFRRNGRRLGYQVARQQFAVGEVMNTPRVMQPILRGLMKHTDTGMQLTVYLKKA